MARISANFINELSPYRVVQVDDLTVRFITENGVKYMVGFTPDAFIFDEGGYDFFIINEAETAKQDHAVYETIIAVIESLFHDTADSAMIYICAPDGGKQAVRARLFEMWFNNTAEASSNYTLKTYNSIDPDSGTSYFYGLILRKDNPNHDKLINVFIEFLADY